MMEERMGRVKLDYTLAQRKRGIIQPLKEERSQRIKQITKRSGEGITLMRAGFTIIPSEKTTFYQLPNTLALIVLYTPP